MPAELLRDDPMLRLVDRIYQAALDPGAWPGVVAELADFMSAPKGKLFTPILGSDKGGLAITVGIPDAADRLWATRYMNDDVWVQAGIAKGLVRTGNVVLDSDLVREEEFVKSRIYREHLRHLDIGRLCSGIVFDGTAHGVPATFVSVARGLERPFGPGEREKMRLLVPHLSRALGVMYRLRDAELKIAASRAALDRLSSGVLLLDRVGRVTHANRKAARLLEEKDGVAMGEGLLVADAAARNRWRQIFGSALAQAFADTPHFADSVSVPRASGRRALVLQVAPLPTSSSFGFTSDAAAIVFILDPDGDARLDGAAMRDLYQATPAEVRLAELLCAGRTVAVAAYELGISETTAKSQLGSLFRRTGTRRQADLLRVLMSLQQAPSTDA